MILTSFGKVMAPETPLSDAALIKPLCTSPFMPEFKRKFSNEILPVQLTSRVSKARRRFSTSGCRHFLRVLAAERW